MTREEDQRIRFGNPSDRDDACGIRNGQIKLSGAVVASFFEPSVNAIFTAVLYQRVHAIKPIKHVIMVGGFSSSDWLLQRVRGALTPYGFTIFCPEGNLAKAVSDGAVSFHLDHFVSTRVTRFGYGTNVCSLYNPRDPEHLKRSSLARKNSNDGKTYIYNQFQVILPKHTAVSEEEEFRSSFEIEFDAIFGFEETTCEIGCYKGLRKERLLWQDAEPGTPFPICISGLT